MVTLTEKFNKKKQKTSFKLIVTNPNSRAKKDTQKMKFKSLPVDSTKAELYLK